MPTTTQISGNIRPHNQSYYALVHLLHHVGICVAHSPMDEPFVYDDAGWALHDSQTAFYQSIAQSDFHTVLSEDDIDDDVGLQIVYALLQSKPIVIAGGLHFAPRIRPFIREVITSQMGRFHAVDIAELDLVELHVLLAQMKPVAYSLTRSEKTLIRSLVAAHFRKLAAHAAQVR